MRPIIRTFLAIILCLGALLVIAFLIVVDIIDDQSRHEDAWAKLHEGTTQDIPSSKPSNGD